MNVDIDSTNVDSQAAFVEAMAARVRRLGEDRAVTQSAVARAGGIKLTTMTKYWNGERAFPVSSLAGIAAALSTSMEFLLTGVETLSCGAADTVGVQEIDLAYGLGGTFASDPVEVQVHEFPRAWLEKITTTPGSALTIARGRGDSMQPTIQDGDMVMIDRSQRTVREQDAIWALTVGDIAMIKRIRARGDRVIILSDNDRVPPDEVHHEEVNVVGRVIFIGHRV